MGYTIEYNSACFKTPKGYTILWLAGSNNVTERHMTSSGRYVERRCRDWGIFGSNAAVPADELIRYGESMTGYTYQEHWKRNGKWVDDATMLRWIRRHINKAVSLEDLLRSNNLTDLSCRLNIWGEQSEYSSRFDLSRSVRTSEEFDQWVTEANNARAKLKKEFGEKVKVFLDIGYDLPEDLVCSQIIEGSKTGMAVMYQQEPDEDECGCSSSFSLQM